MAKNRRSKTLLYLVGGVRPMRCGLLHLGQVEERATYAQPLVAIANLLRAHRLALGDLDGLVNVTGGQSLTGIRMGAAILNALIFSASLPLSSVALRRLTSPERITAILPNLPLAKGRLATLRYR